VAHFRFKVNTENGMEYETHLVFKGVARVGLTFCLCETERGEFVCFIIAICYVSNLPEASEYRAGE